MHIFKLYIMVQRQDLFRLQKGRKHHFNKSQEVSIDKPAIPSYRSNKNNFRKFYKLIDTGTISTTVAAPTSASLNQSPRPAK